MSSSYEEKIAVLKCVNCRKQHNKEENLNEHFDLVIDKVMKDGNIMFKLICHECEGGK